MRIRRSDSAERWLLQWEPLISACLRRLTSKCSYKPPHIEKQQTATLHNSLVAVLRYLCNVLIISGGKEMDNIQ